MTTLFIIKFGSDQMKIVGGVALRYFCSHSLLTKTKKKIVNIWKLKFWNKKKMMDRELPTKFGLDPCSGVWEIWVYRWMDGRMAVPRDGRTPAPRQQLCWQSQADLNSELNFSVVILVFRSYKCSLAIKCTEWVPSHLERPCWLCEALPIVNVHSGPRRAQSADWGAQSDSAPPSVPWLPSHLAGLPWGRYTSAVVSLQKDRFGSVVSGVAN